MPSKQMTDKQEQQVPPAAAAAAHADPNRGVEAAAREETGPKSSRSPTPPHLAGDDVSSRAAADTFSEASARCTDDRKPFAAPSPLHHPRPREGHDEPGSTTSPRTAFPAPRHTDVDYAEAGIAAQGAAAPGSPLTVTAVQQHHAPPTADDDDADADVNDVYVGEPSVVKKVSEGKGSDEFPEAAKDQAADGDDDDDDDNKGDNRMAFGDDQGEEPTPEDYDPANKWWSLSLENVFNLVQLDDGAVGLDKEDVPRHAAMLGDNVIPIKGGPKWYVILARQFMNAITVVLLIVVVISGVFKDWAEFGVVLFILFFNAGLGFYQEFGAERSLSSLKKMTAGEAKVLRSGVPEIVFIDEVVVGDVLILEQGSSVPADCRIFESNNLEIDEALLTGEALPVMKHTNVIPDPDLRCALGDRKNMAYRNTQVTQGRGKAVVVAGGVHTEMGKLAKRLNSGGGGGKTALMKKLDYMMYFLFGCCIVLAVIVFAANKMKYKPSTLSYATAVAIAILPESLCVVITVAMTVSVKQMAQKKCIIRKLPVLEVLGGVTDICSDKTGTLTENKMVVKKAVIGADEVYAVQGAPYESHGDFVRVEESGALGEGFNMAHMYPDHRHMYEFLRSCALCSTTVLHVSDDDPDYLVGNGNPTEIAIQVMTWKGQLNRDTFAQEGWQCICEYAFDSGIKRMSTAWHNERKKELYLCTKGAPERVLALCNWKIDREGKRVNLTDEDRANVDRKIQTLAAQGLRTLCLSCRDHEPNQFVVPADKPFGEAYSREVIEEDLTYLGIVGIYDPPRPESRPSVLACQHAGIVVRMLTGDHTSTAGSIASMLNIISRRDLDDPVKLQAGPDFDAVDPEVIDGWADLPVVVGRCSPESKVRMIEALHRRKRVAAMTGDGFNDSPSIKIADVGCAMGSGVDVTKGVADLVITDDNFSTIVKAVAEGRRIAQCIRKFVVHLLSSNVAEVIALICGLPIRHQEEAVFVLSPIEILWLNLITSAPPATGLSMDKATADILQVPPNTTGFFTIELIADTFVYGMWLGAFTLCSFVVVLYGFNDGPVGDDCNSHRGTGCYPIWQARCTAFGVLYFGLLFHAYTVRHPRLSIFLMKWFDNRWIYGSFALGTVLFIPIVYVNPIAHGLFVHHMLTWHWAVLVIAVFGFLFFSEVHKIMKNCFFPIKKIVVDVDEGEEHELLQEYRTFTEVGHDDRDVQSIAEENLRMSFASHAGSVATAMTGSFAMTTKNGKRKKRSLLRRMGFKRN